MLKFLILMVCYILMINVSVIAGNGIWWEGESFTKSDFVSSDWLDKDIKKTRLSKLNWLSCLVKPDAKDKKKSYSAEYEINVPKDGEYTFWSREFYRKTASPWKFSFNGGDWHKVAKDHKSVPGSISNLGNNRSVVWCEYGKFKLKKGKNKFKIVISEIPSKGFKSGFDAFLLADTSFSPNGWQKPNFLSKKEYIGTFLWLEGEESKNNFITQNDTISKTDKNLSNGKWLVFTKNGTLGGKVYVARWTFTSQLSTSYNFWVRELNKKIESPFSYRINGGRWQKSTSEMTAFDEVTLSNGATACWVEYKKIFLKEGENTLEIKVDGKNSSGKIQLAIDAILLSVEAYIPTGKFRPDMIVKPEDGWFLFRSGSGINTEGKKAILDLRSLNDSKSGIHGFCKVDGKGLIFQDGTRPKFWGVNGYGAMMMNDDAIDTLLRHLAKVGVNLIRINGSLCDPISKRFGKTNDKIMNRLFYFIAQCKKNGIYVALANYNPSDYLITPKDNIEGYSNNDQIKHPYGLLYINKKYRSLYKKWAKFLRRKNPYTGKKLYKDPTIVWFEIQNGQDLIGGGLKLLPKEQKNILDKRFNDWLSRKYSGIGFVLRGWSEAKKYHPVIEADGERGARCFRLLPFDSYHKSIISSKESNHFNKRKIDQLAFLIEEYNKINKELINYIKDTCRFKGLISVGNSTPLAKFILGGINTYLKSAGDIISENKFVNPIRPKNIDDILKPGSFIKGRSILMNPLASPIMNANFKNKASIVTELGWSYPNKYRGEAVPFIAAYASLQGYNPYLWFKADSHSWANRLQKHTLQSPDIMGLFPGFALMFRRGDVAQAAPVIDQVLKLNNMINLKGNTLNINKLASKEHLNKVKFKQDSLNPMAFFIGKVNLLINNSPDSIIKRVVEKKYWNKAKRTLKSVTGELNLNYLKGQLTINTLKAQGFVNSYSKGISEKFKDVIISMQNEIGSVLVISLDNLPLATSKHILIQSFSEAKNNGWKTEKIPQEKYQRLTSLGDSPLIIKKILGDVKFKSISKKGWSAWQLNADGYREKELNIDVSTTELLSIILPKNALYVELKK